MKWEYLNESSIHDSYTKALTKLELLGLSSWEALSFDIKKSDVSEVYYLTGKFKRQL